MALGRKTGGRLAGTPNKRTDLLTAKLGSLGLDPVDELCRIAMSDDVDVELRARVLMDLMGYVYPKRKALDSATSIHQPIVFNIDVGQGKTGPTMPLQAINCSEPKTLTSLK